MTPNPQDSAVALEVELLPCPFCGGGAHFYTVQEGDDAGGRCVVCPQCNASSMLCFPLMDSVDQKLIEHWNRRASQSDGTSGGWQPIETAPKDGSDVLLYCKGKGVVRGRWNDCRFATLPRPYWTNDREHLWGVLSTRIDQPTHWMHLPAAPNQGENHVG